MQRPVRPASRDPGERLAGGAVVTAVDPQLAVPAQPGRQGAPFETLQPPRPMRGADSGRDRPVVQRRPAERPRRRHGDARVFQLMGAEQARRRDLHPAALVAIGSAIAMPFRAVAAERRCDLAGAGGDRAGRLRGLLADDGGDSGLQYAGLLEGDLGDGFAEKVDVIAGDRRDHRQGRIGDRIGRIEPPAEPGLDQRDIGIHPGEG